MAVTKEALGVNYVTGTGVVMSVLSAPVLVRPAAPSTTGVAAIGLLAAVGLAATGVWLWRSRLRNEQVWRVATHVGLGIGVVTVATLVVLQGTNTVAIGSIESTLLASSIVVGGAGGAVIGSIREFERSTRTLTQSTSVLSRALRHNLRNDLTVIQGHLDEIEADVSESAAERVAAIRRTVEDLVDLSEQAQRIELAVTGEERRRHPIDVVEIVDRRVRATEAAHPGVAVATDLPETAWVSADWMLETAIENVIGTAIANGGAETTLEIHVERSSLGWVAVRIVDTGGHLPATETAPLDSGTETPLQHGNGLGLWLVTWIVESLDGTLTFDRTDGGCVVTLRLRRAIPTPRDRA